MTVVDWSSFAFPSPFKFLADSVPVLGFGVTVTGGLAGLSALELVP